MHSELAVWFQVRAPPHHGGESSCRDTSRIGSSWRTLSGTSTRSDTAVSDALARTPAVGCAASTRPLPSPGLFTPWNPLSGLASSQARTSPAAAASSAALCASGARRTGVRRDWRSTTAATDFGTAPLHHKVTSASPRTMPA
ncbi:hypothetical protein [Saccharothrix hoggarensis]|uniref:Uncharacterized protein n=1 Tax=Saccharothrix hoggarensis TaxID=913853 RepID=A0ABW3QJ21_9PSEU